MQRLWGLGTGFRRGHPRDGQRDAHLRGGQFSSTSWYGNDKPMQELAKDAFDAIDNMKAFAW